VRTDDCVLPYGHRVAPQPGCQYIIRIGGRLGATALSAFPAMTHELIGGDTVLSGVLVDQAAVFGVIAQMEALGLELLELRQCVPEPDRPARKSPSSGEDSSPRSQRSSAE
jgi:hypothetical protein